jgi:CRISP-associated protein Cas1
MPTVSIHRKGCELRTGTGYLIVGTSQGEERIPFHLIDRLQIAAAIAMDSRVVFECAGRGIPVVWQNPGKADQFAITEGPQGADSTRRVKQLVCYLKEEWKLEFMKRCVRQKLYSQLRVVERIAEERVEHRMKAWQALEQMRSALKQLEEPTLNGKMIRGLEGAAARSYYAVLGLMFGERFGFSGRNRRPPKDPVNVMLSLGYTILHFECVDALRNCGLDASVGYLHEAKHGRQGLACDLAEPFRAKVDELIWLMCRKKTIRPEHFQMQGERCLMGKAGRREFYQQMEGLSEQLRPRLRRGSELIRKAVDRQEIEGEAEDEENALPGQ